MSSLRFRLTAMSMAVIAVALVGAGVLLHHQLGASLLSSIDDAARSEAHAAVLDLGAQRVAAAARVGDEDTVVQIIGPAGNALASSRNVRGQKALFGFQATDHVRFHNIARLPFPNSADYYRVAAVIAPGGDSVYVAVASDDRHDTLQVLDSALFVGLPSVLVVLVLIAWVAIGRALRPVERLRLQAAAISETSLDQRLASPSTTELRDLADTLNDLLERVSSSTVRQREFIADAAHELRSPLASLRTQVEVGNRTDADAHMLIRLVDRLSELVDDLLQLAQLDGRVPLHRVAIDLDDLVVECVADIRTRSAVPIDISKVSAAQLVGSRSAMSRLVRNLIENACQHASTRVTVSLAVDQDEIELAVADDGPGIPEADRSRVFERFTRLDAGRDRAAGGVGLGLAIAADAVSSHGGQIEIRDNAPGAIFVVRLPAAVAAAPHGMPV